MYNFKRFHNDFINIDEDKLIKSISSTHIVKEMDRNFTIYFARSMDTSYTDVNMIYESDLFNGPYFWFNYPTQHLLYFSNAANGDKKIISELKEFYGVLWNDVILDIIIIFNQNDFFNDFSQNENQLNIFSK